MEKGLASVGCNISVYTGLASTLILRKSDEDDEEDDADSSEDDEDNDDNDNDDEDDCHDDK